MSGLLEVKLDDAQLARMANLLGAAGKNAGKAIVRAVNHTGDKARTRMVRTLTAQTGLKRKVIVRALKVDRASTGGPKGNGARSAYVIRSRGGDISLKFFGAKEGPGGVTAKVRGKSWHDDHAFMTGGRWPNRTRLKLGGHVYKRLGRKRIPIAEQRSGLFIPEEMITGESEAAFFEVVESDLTDRLVHEVGRLLEGGR
ncbi:hypothetical protein SAMN05216548_10527 [Faunimonas pinastri]|uniref:Prophage minor tail protein Z (GPZ) n=1 Tax=Faunimonas pinastri TaxID=1855383 RepID=A0A1H9GFV0_9HYPH|nr:hypothetical protein [Faunimonas pinastri]SEQ48995.1 hypothetical protein SAMN05216548_10527 [Faunimonas pinastri]